MAKKQLKFKPTPAGILFLAAIGVLLIAIIVLIVFAATKCGSCKKAEDGSAEGDKNLPPVTGEVDPLNTVDPFATPDASADPSADPNADPNATVDPNATADPNATVDPNATPDALSTPDPNATPSSIVVNTPGQTTTSASPGTSANPTPKIYTSPTSKQKKNAQKGYIKADKVNMRKGPGQKYDLVKSKIARYTAVTLYEEQSGWWFLKCGDKYGYIKADYIAKGTAPSTASPTGSSAASTSNPVNGKVSLVHNDSVAALRQKADKGSKCIKEYANGSTMTIYYYVKGADGMKWYYVKMNDGKTGFMRSDLVSASGKVKAG